MKTYTFKWLLLLLLGVLLGCESDDSTDGIEEPEEITSGTADFSNYVAVGNSVTAGYTDGALFNAGQLNSVPNILASRFALAGGGDFTQPLVTDNVGGLVLQGNIIVEPRLFFNGTAPERLTSIPTTDVSNVLTGPFNNMGIPGAKIFHLLYSGYGNVSGVIPGLSNPYFVRMASSPASTVLEDVVNQNPTFFSLWIGTNDVLSYATSGGEGVDQAGNNNPATYGGKDITDPQVFAQAFTILVTNLVETGADGVVANIPNVLQLPYFTTVPHNPLEPDNPVFGPQIPILNQTFASLNQVFSALGIPERSIIFSETAASPVIVEDESLTDLSAQIEGALKMGGADPDIAEAFGFLYGQARPATEEDLLVLTSSSIIAQLNDEGIDSLVDIGLGLQMAGQLAINGITYPLKDKWVLTPSEQQNVIQATGAFNQTIKSIAETNELAFVDINSDLNELATTGVDFDEFSLDSRLVFGGAFSLDGIHPTARGSAYIANRFIEAINETYGSNLPLVKAAAYNTVYPKEF